MLWGGIPPLKKKSGAEQVSAAEAMVGVGVGPA